MNYVQLGDVLSQATTVRAGTNIYPILSMTMHNGLVPQHEKFKKSVSSVDLSGYKVVARGQLVVGFPIDEGVLSFQQDFENALVSPAYGIWDIRDSENVYAPYLEQYLRSRHALGYYKAKLRGSTARRRSLPASSFTSMPVPLPSYRKQQCIMDILEKADALRAKRREAIAHLDSLGQSIFHEMFAEAGSPEVTLVEILRTGLRNGLSPSTAGQVSGEVLTLGAITGAHLDLTQKKTALFDSVFHGEQLLCPGKLLICRGNGNKSLVGRAKVVGKIEGHIGYPDTIIAGDLDVERVDPLFVQSAWGTQQVRRQIELGATTTNGTYKVNQKLLSSIRLPLPPRDLQHEFALKTRSIERLKMRHVGQLELLDNLFNSLQDRAFKGDL